VRFLCHVYFGRVSLPSAELNPIQDHISEVMGGDCKTKGSISDLLRMDAMSARRRFMVHFSERRQPTEALYARTANREAQSRDSLNWPVSAANYTATSSSPRKSSIFVVPTGF